MILCETFGWQDDEQTLIEITSRFYWLRGNCGQETEVLISSQLKGYSVSTTDLIQVIRVGFCTECRNTIV